MVLSPYYIYVCVLYVSFIELNDWDTKEYDMRIIYYYFFLTVNLSNLWLGEDKKENKINFYFGPLSRAASLAILAACIKHKYIKKKKYQFEIQSVRNSLWSWNKHYVIWHVNAVLTGIRITFTNWQVQIYYTYPMWHLDATIFMSHAATDLIFL